MPIASGSADTTRRPPSPWMASPSAPQVVKRPEKVGILSHDAGGGFIGRPYGVGGGDHIDSDTLSLAISGYYLTI